MQNLAEKNIISIQQLRCLPGFDLGRSMIDPAQRLATSRIRAIEPSQ